MKYDSTSQIDLISLFLLTAFAGNAKGFAKANIFVFFFFNSKPEGNSKGYLSIFFSVTTLGVCHVYRTY